MKTKGLTLFLLLVFTLTLFGSKAFAAITTYPISNNFVFGQLSSTFSFGGRTIQSLPAWGTEIAFEAFGTDATFHTFSSGGVYVSIDGGATTTIPDTGGAVPSVSLFSGLSDTWHSVVITADSGNYVDANDMITLTGSSPQIRQITGRGIPIDLLGTRGLTYIQQEGDPASTAATGSTNPNSKSWRYVGALIRFKTDRSTIKLRYFNGNGSDQIALFTDSNPTPTLISTYPATSADEYKLRTIATGLDTSTVHEYTIVYTTRNANMYPDQLVLVTNSATDSGDGLVEYTYPTRDKLLTLGDSITQGYSESIPNYLDGYTWLTARKIGLALENRGINFGTVSTGLGIISQLDDATPAANVKKITELYGTNDAPSSPDPSARTQFKTDLTSLYNNLLSTYTNATIYALGILPSSRGNSGQLADWSTAKQEVVTSINNPRLNYVSTTNWIDVNTDVPDSVHPTASAGHPKIANRLTPLLSTTGFTVSAPSIGTTGQASSNFTVTLANGATFTGDQTVTIADSNQGGLFTPSVGVASTSLITVTPANGATSFTFTYTPSSTGTKTLTYTNGQGWTNPSISSFVVSAPASGGCGTQYVTEGNTTYQITCGVKTVYSTTPSGSTGGSTSSNTTTSTTTTSLTSSVDVVQCPIGNTYNTSNGKKCTVFVEAATTRAVDNPVITQFFTKDLKLGMTDKEVKLLQQHLNAFGFPVSVSGAGSVGNESTFFGTKTKAALIKFQMKNYIHPAVGYFGTVTRNIINSKI